MDKIEIRKCFNSASDMLFISPSQKIAPEKGTNGFDSWMFK